MSENLSLFQPMSNSLKHIDVALSVDLLGRALRKLTVGDRLLCERVSPRWKWAVSEQGWTEQRKLDYEILFERVYGDQIDRFSHANLCSLLNRLAGPNLQELKLEQIAGVDYSPNKNRPPFITESLRGISRLVKLDIGDFRLADLVNFLPPTLRQLRFFTLYRSIRMELLEALALQCPNLEEVPFHLVLGINFGIVNGYLQRFSRLKKLSLCGVSNDGGIGSIGQLKELEELKLSNFKGFDEHTYEALITGCQSLRKLNLFSTEPFSDESSLCRLVELRNLTVLEVHGDTAGALTDFVLKEIAKRGQLKKLLVKDSPALTDDPLLFLIDRCKSLVSLDVEDCWEVTERTLEAVVAEIERRYEASPWTLPIGTCWRMDNRVFYFGCKENRIGVQIRTLLRNKKNEFEDDGEGIDGDINNLDLVNGYQQILSENTKKCIELALANPWIHIVYKNVIWFENEDIREII